MNIAVNSSMSNNSDVLVKGFTIGVNKKVVGKCEPQKLSYSGAWKAEVLNFEGLAKHIGKGHPWMPALLDGNGNRWQTNANTAQVLGADIDSGMSIAEALEHPFITAHAGLLIESASSTIEQNKFRLVFRLPETLTDWQSIRICNRYLISLLGVADKACKDASRFFFGAPDREPLLLNESAVLPDSFVAEAMAWHQDLELAAQREQDMRSEYLSTIDVSSQAELVRQALAFIPPYSPGNGTYNDLIAMAAGIVNELGSEGVALLEAWNGFGSETSKKVRGLSRTPGKKATLGSVFHIAKEYGFKFPATNSGWTDRKSDRPKAKAKNAPAQNVEALPSIDEIDEPDISYAQAVHANGASIDFDRLLHPKLARLLRATAATLPVNPEATYLHYRSVMCSTIGTRAKLIIRPGYMQGLTCWTANLADPGAKKSPNMKKLTRPLEILQSEAKEAHKEAMREYSIAYRTWQKNSKDDPELQEPEKPAMREWFIVDATMESLGPILAHPNNHHGTLAVYDELSGWFGAMDAYRGNSSDRANWLSLMNGGSVKTNRKDASKNIFVEQTAVSLTGATHPDTLHRMMADSTDKNDGLWDRFRFGFTKYVSIRNRGQAFDTDPIFLDLYRNLDRIQERTYQLSPAAEKLFYEFELWIEDQQHRVSKRMFSALNKMQWKLGVEILALHLEDAAIEGNPYPEAQIPRSVVERAMHAINYDILQQKLLHDRLIEQVLDNRIFAAIELAKSTTECTPRNLLRKTIVKTTQEGHELIQEMVKKGLGAETIEGRKRIFTYTEGAILPNDMAFSPTAEAPEPEEEPIEFECTIEGDELPEPTIEGLEVGMQVGVNGQPGTILGFVWRETETGDTPAAIVEVNGNLAECLPNQIIVASDPGFSDVEF